MLKKIRNHASLFLWGLLLLTAACTDNDLLTSDTQNTRLPVVFSSSVTDATATRVIDVAWDAGDAIGVFMKRTGTELSSDNLIDNAANKQYVISGTSGSFFPVSGNNIYYPTDGSKVDFIAYYPYRSNVDGYIYKVDVTGQQSASSVDLMYADNLKGADKTTTTSELLFSRQLSNIVLNITAGKGVSSLSGLSVTLKGMYTRADFNLANGSLTIDETSKADVRVPLLSNSSGVYGNVIVLPAESLEGVSLVFELQGESYTLKLNANTSLKKGVRLSYAIELKDSGATEQPGDGNPTWFETPLLTSGDNLQYVTHYMPEDENVRNYSMLYDKQYRLAYWVAYPMHSYYIGDAKRTDAWGYDPKIDQNWQPRLSRGFGITNIDRGHQLASADRTSSTAANRTTFYYSNMTAQVGQGLNQTIWASLEGQVRNWMQECDTLYVVTGAMITTAADPNITYVEDNDGKQVAKPKYYFKALAKKKGSEYYTVGFRFNNAQYPGTDYNQYRVTVSSLEQETGFTFFPRLSSEVKGKIESTQW